MTYYVVVNFLLTSQFLNPYLNIFCEIVLKIITTFAYISLHNNKKDLRISYYAHTPFITLLLVSLKRFRHEP